MPLSRDLKPANLPGAPPALTGETRECVDCGEIKPVKDFALVGKARQGPNVQHSDKCRLCARKASYRWQHVRSRQASIAARFDAKTAQATDTEQKAYHGHKYRLSKQERLETRLSKAICDRGLDHVAPRGVAWDTLCRSYAARYLWFEEHGMLQDLAAVEG